MLKNKEVRFKFSPTSKINEIIHSEAYKNSEKYHLSHQDENLYKNHLKFIQSKPDNLYVVFVDGHYEKKLSSENLNFHGIHIEERESFKNVLFDDAYKSLPLDQSPHDINVFHREGTSEFNQKLYAITLSRTNDEHINNVHLIHFYTQNEHQKHFTTINVEVASKSQWHIYEHYPQRSENNIISNQTVVTMLPYSSCHHYINHNILSPSLFANDIHVFQYEHSIYENYNFSIHAPMAFTDINVHLLEEYAIARCHGLYLNANDYYKDYYIHMNHLAPNCESYQYYKGLGLDKSTSNFCGRIFVEKNAQKTDAYQTNNQLVLSDTARMYSMPQLEIYADDVKCSHGSTSGLTNYETLFYLQSRGISESEAKVMLLKSFGLDVFSNIACEDFLEETKDHFEQWLIDHPIESEWLYG